MPDSDTDLLVASLRDAGAIARKYFGGVYKVWRKAGGDPVSEADIAIDGYLKDKLTAARPDYGWISEETVDDRVRLARAKSFVVDPIDGTHGFLKGRPQFTIVAAVVAQGRPISGAIYNPMTEEMYEAAHAHGARKNGKTIRVSARSDFKDSRLLATKKFTDPSRWTTPWPEGIVVETRASLAYRMALVAEGAFDAMISLSRKSDWDLAAGDLLVHEAGGYVTSADGAVLTYNRERLEQQSVICANPALHRHVVARLKDQIPPVEQ